MNMKLRLLPSQVTSIIKLTCSRLGAGCLFLLASALSAEDVQFPTIPTEAVDKYAVTAFNERVESVDLPALRVSGRQLTFKMDAIGQHTPAQAPEGVSLRLQHYANPLLQVELVSFKADDFAFDLDEQTLRDYLKGIEQQYSVEQNFEVLEEPVISTGPARFRFLGQRAIPMRYKFTEGGNDLTRAENWFLIGDNIHVISIQGPSRFFDGYFESIRIPFNSSVPLDN